MIGTRTGILWNNWTGGDCPNYNIVEIGQNTAKCPGDMRRLVATQTEAGKHQLTLVRKTWKEVDIIIIIKKIWYMKVMVISVVFSALGIIPKWLVKGTSRLRNKRTSGDHKFYTIIKIGQNTEKSSGDLRRLAVTQTLVKDHHLNRYHRNRLLVLRNEWRQSTCKHNILLICIKTRTQGLYKEYQININYRSQWQQWQHKYK